MMYNVHVKNKKATNRPSAVYPTERGRRMNKDEIRKDEVKKGLKCCSAIDFETSCSDCPYRYRCFALYRDALDIITKQEKEIDALKEKCELLKEYEE